jgi:hypothetical protein
MKIIENIKIEECCTCGVLWGISQIYHEGRKEDKRSFYCPNGHSQAYIKSTSQILNETIEAKNKQIQILEKQLKDTEKVKKTRKKRINKK